MGFRVRPGARGRWRGGAQGRAPCGSAVRARVLPGPPTRDAARGALPSSGAVWGDQRCPRRVAPACRPRAPGSGFGRGGGGPSTGKLREHSCSFMNGAPFPAAPVVKGLQVANSGYFYTDPSEAGCASGCFSPTLGDPG